MSELLVILTCVVTIVVVMHRTATASASLEANRRAMWAHERLLEEIRAMRAEVAALGPNVRLSYRISEAIKSFDALKNAQEKTNG